MPKVSVVIPAYGDGKGLKRLLDSLYSQEFKDFDVFVSDDTEDGGLCSVCEEYPGVFYYDHSKERNGAAANWNKALSLADGEYVKIMHGDDFFTFPYSLGRMVELLDDSPDAVMAFSGSRQVPEQGKSYDRHTPGRDLKRFREDPKSIFNVGNTIGSPSAVIVRRSDVTYDERLTWLVDMEYYIHLLSEGGSFASTDEPLISIGVSDRQLTRKVSEDEELVKRERGIISEKYGIEDRAEKVEGLSVEGFLFYAGLTLEILWVILDKSAYIIESEGILFRMSFVPLFLSVVIGFFKRRYGKRDCIYFAAFFVLGVISYLCSSRNDIIRILFLVFASANASPKKYLRYTFFVTLSGCIVLSLLSFTGILGTVMTDKEVGEGVTRRLLTLGMGHPNSLFAMFFALTALGLFIWYDRFNLKWGLLLLFADAGLFFMTASRMGFVCTAMSILFTLLMKKSSSLRDGKWFYHISSAVIILMAVLSLMTAKYGEIYNSYDPPWFEPHFETVMKPLDRYMSGRLWNAYGYPDSDISRFSAFSSPENTRYVDMGYYKLFYWYGYVPGWIYVGICIALLMVSCRKKIPALGVFVAVWCFYNFMEAHEISDFIGRNYIWLMSFYLPGLFLGRGDVSV